MTVETFIGDGQVRLTQGTNAAVLIDGMQAFSVSSTENEVSLQNYDDGAGGKLDSYRELQDVTISIEFASHKKEILSSITRGTSSTLAAGAVTGEEHTAYTGWFVAFDKLPDTAQSIVVKSDSGATTLTIDVDYTLSTNGAGVTILQETNITANTIAFDYTALDTDEVIAFQSAPPIFKLQIDGFNKAKTKAYYFEAEKVRLGVPDSIALITAEFNTITVTGEILKADDSSYNGGFYKWRK